jgi:hypothetical protein
MSASQIKSIAEDFTNGTPVEEEVELEDGVVFHFDNPFPEDTEEPYVVASLMIDKSEYNDVRPEENDVGEVDYIDSMVQTELRDGGFTGISGPEFDESNSTESYYEFVYILQF